MAILYAWWWRSRPVVWHWLRLILWLRRLRLILWLHRLRRWAGRIDLGGRVGCRAKSIWLGQYGGIGGGKRVCPKTTRRYGWEDLLQLGANCQRRCGAFGGAERRHALNQRIKRG